MAGEEAKSYLAKMTKRFNAGYAKVYDELCSNRSVGHGPTGSFS
jgi:hypothetical protein